MRRRAFTLIELLVVIAIIALLSAIIFPVFARAREQAARAGDISAMNDLRSALQLYRVDNGGYPPALLGYVNRYASGPNAGNVIPADQIAGFLFPKRVASVNTFRPSSNRVAPAEITTAVWPAPDARALGTAPILDLNGDGRIDANDDVNGARQAYSAGVQVLTQPRLPAGPSNPVAEYYRISGYDVAEVKATSSVKRVELRYALFWSNFAIGQGAGFGAGSAFDDPRQLGYNDPPENTVITWNSFYRDYEPIGANVVPVKGNKDMVLFLGGAARPFDSRRMYDQAWRVLP